MKRIAFLLLFLPSIAFAADLPIKNSGNGLPQSSPVLHFSNWGGTGQGTPYFGDTLFYKHRWRIDMGGTLPSAVKATLKGRDDYGTWFILDTYSSVTPDATNTRWVHNKGSSSFRVDVVTFTNGSTITINSKHGGT